MKAFSLEITGDYLKDIAKLNEIYVILVDNEINKKSNKLRLNEILNNFKLKKTKYYAIKSLLEKKSSTKLNLTYVENKKDAILVYKD